MSDYLLVPTNVQAFVVGKPAKEPLYDLVPMPRTQDAIGKTQDAIGKTQEAIGNWYRDTKYSFSFEASKLTSQLESGVHLHWALPTALMHAHHKGSEPPEQPCIPNRWLVQRMWHAANNSEISAKAWVVESDYESDDAQSGGTPFLFCGPPVQLKYVGRTLPWEGWQETDPTYRFELTSSAWGDPSFAAYYPACKGVLGFYDKLDGVEKGNLLTYIIMGWYSDSTKDPLHPINGPDTLQQCKERLASLGWSCPDLKDAALPQRTLCHGGVVGLTWQGTKYSYPPPSVGSTTPTVAIGGNVAEALAALLAQESKSPESNKSLQQVLCAFQHGQATQVSDDYQLGELLHRHGFNAVSGGKHWSIEPIERNSDAQSTLPPVPVTIQRLLVELNQAQQALNRHARKIESLRSRLFACWVTWASKQKGPPPRPNRDVVHFVTVELKTATNELGQYEQGVETCKKALDDALSTEQTGMRLVESTMPPFLHPKDPFVVLKGGNLAGIDRTRTQRPEKEEEEEKKEEEGGALPCRLETKIVTGVSQEGTSSQTWSADTCFPLPDFSNVAGVSPGDIARALAVETLLFDPNCAGLIKTADDRLFKTLQESLDMSRKSDGNKLSWVGQPPDPLGVTRWEIRNPWLPVYLMWQANWAPSYALGPEPDTHPPALVGWQLKSPFDPLANDLVPQSQQKGPAKGSFLLQGATIISTLSGAPLVKHLRKFAEAGGYKVNNLEGIEQTQVLGQSLGGFNDLLLRQTLGLCLPPVDPTSNENKVDAAIWNGMGQAPQPTMPVMLTFLPMRTGALTLLNLYLVDSFGQTRKLIDSSNSSSSQPTVITSAELPPPPADYHAGLSPRLIQPARLNFDWQLADGDPPGPVCGWIVANFLEKSFAVFSATGEPLGALQSVLPALGEKTIDSKVTFTWRPIPGSTLLISGISNERLRRFVTLAADFRPDERQAFLELVDLVLRKTEARLPPEDPSTAVLLGRPLALVHASLGLEVQGLPAGYWKTDGAWTFETEGFEKLRVPVRLGGMNLPSDGLLGYMLDTDAPCLFASEGATRRIGDSNRIKYGQDLTVACTDAPPVSLTLLMDASARVHATTGILPRHFIQLPPGAGKQVGLIEEVYFGVAPVLGARPQESAAQPAMPRPSDAFGQWSWATRPTLGWNEIKPADDRARFANGLALSEGWLKLRLKRDQDNAAPGNETEGVKP